MAKLIEHFRALPGIGSKTAVRLAYHILDMEPAQAKALAQAIIEAKEIEPTAIFNIRKAEVE